MTREKIIDEIGDIAFRYPVKSNCRLYRRYKKADKLNDKNLNNLLKNYRLHKMFNASL